MGYGGDAAEAVGGSSAAATASAIPNNRVRNVRVFIVIPPLKESRFLIFGVSPNRDLLSWAPGWLPLVAKTTSISLTNSECGFGFYMNVLVAKNLSLLTPKTVLDVGFFVLSGTIRSDSREQKRIACPS